MKRIFILLLVLVFVLIGCTPKEPVEENNIDEEAIVTVELYINMLPATLTEANREEVEFITSLVNELTEEEVALVENYDIYQNALNFFSAIDEEKTARNELFTQLEAELNELVPNLISEDITLPTKIETELGDVTVIWGSSDFNTLKNNGVIIQGRKPIRVTLTTTLILDGERYSFTQVTNVAPITFDELPAKGLSIAYMTVRTNFTEFDELQSKAIDVVNYSFAQIVNGEISVLALGDLQNLLLQRRKGIRILFSIGPYEDQFIGPASTAAGRTKLVDSIVEAVEKYHFDGVDIDWETPNSTTRQNYTLLMEELGLKLKRAHSGYLLTAATHSASLLGYDFARLNEVIDFYNIMTYDLNARERVTHNSALYYSNNSAGSYSGHNAVTNYIANGAPKSKLVLGAAFYGKQYILENPNGAIIGRTVVASSVSNITFANINTSLLNRLNDGVTRYWDDVAKAPYLHDATNGTVTVYEDSESIMHKANYIIENDLKGIMYWQLNQDYNGILLQSIYDNLITKR